MAIICPKKEMLALNGQYIPHCSCVNDDEWNFDLQMQLKLHLSGLIHEQCGMYCDDDDDDDDDELFLWYG